MGSRRGASSHAILGSGSGARSSQVELQRKLRNAPPKAVAEKAFQTAAMLNPTIGAAYLAYQAGTFAYPIVKKGLQEYAKTGDKDKAIEKVAEETAKQAGIQAREKTVETTVSFAVDVAAKAAHIPRNKVTEEFAKDAISDTINDAIDESQK